MVVFSWLFGLRAWPSVYLAPYLACILLSSYRHHRRRCRFWCRLCRLSCQRCCRRRLASNLIRLVHAKPTITITTYWIISLLCCLLVSALVSLQLVLFTNAFISSCPERISFFSFFIHIHVQNELCCWCAALFTAAVAYLNLFVFVYPILPLQHGLTLLPRSLFLCIYVALNVALLLLAHTRRVCVCVCAYGNNCRCTAIRLCSVRVPTNRLKWARSRMSS